jgi:8-oxo-dGTP pyrophosphatase MutT (NUDIX family)
MPRPDDVGVGVALLLLWPAPAGRGRVLLGLRKGAHAAGVWAPPGGWLDRSDTSTWAAAQRELWEETGLELTRPPVPFAWTTEDHPELGVRTVTLYHLVRISALPVGLYNVLQLQEPPVREPDKCERWAWFSCEDLPDNLYPGLREAIEQLPY